MLLPPSYHWTRDVPTWEKSLHRTSIQAKTSTAWKVSKYGPEKTPYLDTFHTVVSNSLLAQSAILNTNYRINISPIYKSNLRSTWRDIIVNSWFCMPWLVHFPFFFNSQSFSIGISSQGNNSNLWKFDARSSWPCRDKLTVTENENFH